MEVINPVNELLGRPSNVWGHYLENLFVELQISSYLPCQIILHLWFVEKRSFFFSHGGGGGHSFSSRLVLFTSAESTRQKMKLQQQVETYLSIQYRHIACALWIALAACVPPKVTPILQLENKFSVLLWMLGSEDK